MNTVKDTLRTKGQDVWSISPDASVYEALQLMADKNIGAVLVTQGEELVGILSERDYARKTVLLGRSSRETAVREIMTSEVVFVRPENNMEQCMALMTEKRIRHLPVLENDRLVGLISIGDIVKGIISHQGYIIEQLEGYIKGSW
jgi:CBS domain-containing protein